MKPDLDPAADLYDANAVVTVEQRIEQLLTEARAARSGSDGPADLERAHALYLQAAELGSADADYVLGVFALTGRVVTKDVRQALLLLRRAADRGHLQARVHLCNLHDSGAHGVTADAERALLFARAAARSLELVDFESDEAQRALAEAGVARCIDQVEEADDEERERWRRKARALGHAPPRGAAEPITPAPSSPPVRLTTPAPGSAHPAPSSADARALAHPGTATIETRPAPAKRASTLGPAFGGLGFSLLFLAAGWGVGVAAHGAIDTALAQGAILPVRAELAPWALPLAVAAVGLFPGLFLYRLEGWARAVLVAAVAGFAGFVAHGSGSLPLLPDALLQATASACLGYMLAILVAGLRGERRPG